MPAPMTFLAVVQRSDDPAEQETEVVTMTIENGLPVWIVTDGTRITAVEQTSGARLVAA